MQLLFFHPKNHAADKNHPFIAWQKSSTQYTCFRRVACTHADPSARLLPHESYKLMDLALNDFVHYRLLHAEPMAYYIFYISRRKRPHEEKFKNC